LNLEIGPFAGDFNASDKMDLIFKRSFYNITPVVSFVRQSLRIVQSAGRIVQSAGLEI
jgi:hypothetical protein